MKKIQLKMKALECSQDFSHYKSMGIFPDAQGQLTPQSMVGSGRISNSSETSWLSSLPAKMKKIQSKMKALECSQNYTLIISDAQGQITPESVVVSCRNLNSSELLCMSSLPARMKMIALNIFIHINENKHINKQYITMVYDGIQKEAIRLIRICFPEMS